MHPILPISLVFIGCCSNVVFLELLIKECPSSGNIITLAQFLFIALEGFLTTSRFGTKAPVIPISTYAVMVSLFFVTSVANNYALNFNISVPLHMIFRAGSLIANLILGVIILKRRYKISKHISVLMISIGIATATIASAGEVKTATKESGEVDHEAVFYDYARWLFGLALLTFALFLSARMGIYQETVYTTYGKHPSEALFYNHALPLPVFLLLYKDFYHHILLFNQSELMEIPLLMIPVPKMWLYLLGNVATQYVCIKGVFILTSECPSLIVTLVVTLRKFVSLLFSIIYFQNPFTVYHWIGTALVFGGTLLFSDVLSMLGKSITDRTKKRD